MRKHESECIHIETKIGRGVISFQFDLIYCRCRCILCFVSRKENRLRDENVAFDLFKYLSTFIFVDLYLFLDHLIGIFFIFMITQGIFPQKKRVFEDMLVPLCQIYDLFMVLGMYFENKYDRPGKDQYRNKDLNECKSRAKMVQ